MGQEAPVGVYYTLNVHPVRVDPVDHSGGGGGEARGRYKEVVSGGGTRTIDRRTGTGPTGVGPGPSRPRTGRDCVRVPREPERPRSGRARETVG